MGVSSSSLSLISNSANNTFTVESLLVSIHDRKESKFIRRVQADTDYLLSLVTG